MGIVRFATRLIKLGLLAYVCVTLAMLAWTFLWPDPDISEVKPADVIICLGGGMSPDGTLETAVLTRIERCVQLFDADRAPVILFSGGKATPNGPSAGDQMARYAHSLGVPRDQTIAEGRAHSTLQNAIFSLGLVADAQDFIIVTEAFHLPRSWASFRWATWETGAASGKSFQLVMSQNVRHTPSDGGVQWTMLARESLAIWFNAGRAVVYSLAPAKSIAWLH